MRNPRVSNGAARRKRRQDLRAQGRPCWICQAFGRPGGIDYSLPALHPLSFEVDELVPVSRWREGGYSSPTAAALDPRNLAPAHRCCNQWRRNKSVDEVIRIARGGTGGPKLARSVEGTTSREW